MRPTDACHLRGPRARPRVCHAQILKRTITDDTKASKEKRKEGKNYNSIPPPNQSVFSKATEKKRAMCSKLMRVVVFPKGSASMEPDFLQDF